MTDLINVGSAPNDPTADPLRTAFQKVNANIFTKLTANATFYVSTTGNDSTGDGSSGNPWATPQKAADYICSTLNLNGYNISVLLAGTALSPLSYPGALIVNPINSRVAQGGSTAGYMPLIVFTSEAGDADAVLLQYGVAGVAFGGNGCISAWPCITNITIDGSVNTLDAVLCTATNLSTVFINGDGSGGTTKFKGGLSTTAGDMMYADTSGQMLVNDTIDIDDGKFDYAFYADYDGTVLASYWAPAAFTFSNPTLAETAQVGLFYNSGTVRFLTGTTFAGTVTGTKFAANGNTGVIDLSGMSGSDLSTLPGSLAGHTSNGGAYLSATVVLRDRSLLPSSDPHIVGAEYLSVGAIKVSAG